MIKLSFIVPVYNVAPYLRKCVDSLLVQDYDDYEIILVDDGSTDDSPQICDEYVKAYPQPLPKGKGDSFASVWGAHTADSTQYNLLKENASANRKNPTEAESVLWDMLKTNNLGLHFRRQHVILDYIVDFICLEKGLVIELDGGYHNNPEQAEYDKQRTSHLKKLGYTELRFTNEELLTNPDAVIARIKSVASSLPSLQGRAGVRPPIRVIHQANAGLSAARNTGILAARGEYLCFVDSDDYWEENVLGGLMKQVERENLDVLRFDYQNVRTIDAEHLDAEHIDARRLEYEVFEPNKTPRTIDRKNEIVDGESYLNTRMGYACYAWQFILRRDLILPTNTRKNDSFPLRVKSFARSNVQRTLVEQNGVGCLFTKGLHFEDVDWLPRMMLKAKRVNSTQTIVYNYFWREGSITLTQGNKEKIRKNVEDQLYIIEQYKDYLEHHPLCTWLKNMQSNMVAGVLTAVARSFYPERKRYISRIKTLNVFPLSIADQGKTYKRRAILVNILGAEIYSKIMHWR